MASSAYKVTPPSQTVVKETRIKVTLRAPGFDFPEWYNAARAELNSIAMSAAKRQATTAAEGQIVPITLGYDPGRGGDLVDAFVYANKLILVVSWGLGPYEAVTDIKLGGQPFTGTVRTYLGDNVDPLDTVLAAARPLYTANPTDFCFSVLEVPTSYTLEGLEVTGTVWGRNDIYDPRLNAGAGGYAWTANPSLVLGWYVTNFYGEAVNETDLETCADGDDEALDTLSGDEIADRGIYRRRIGLTALRAQKKSRWLTGFQEYAQVFLVREGDTVRMNHPTDETPTLSIVPGLVPAGKFSKEYSSVSRVPNRVTVIYSDINGDEVVDRPYSTPEPAGGVPIREETVRMDGIQALAPAIRYATERLNRHQLGRLSGSVEMVDDGIKYLGGRLVYLTDQEGTTSKVVRLLPGRAVGKTNWQFKWVAWDPLMLSDVVESEPSVADTSLPSPSAVPNVGSVTLSVEIPQFQSGLYFSSIRATWPELTDYPFDRTFDVVFKQGGTIVGTVPGTPDLEAVFGPLQEGKTYTVEVRAIGVFGARAQDVSTASIAVDGKDFPPTDVPNFVAFGIGGELRTRWGQSSDNQAIWRYELRYGASGVTWENATLLTREDSLSYNTKELPAGTYDILIKAIDNAGNYSTNASRAAGVELDQSADIYLLDSVDADTDEVSTTGFTELPNGKFVTDSGETFNSLFPNAMNTYTNPLLSYQTPASSIYYSLELDPGVGEIGGIWQATPDVEVLSGVPTSEIETYNGSTWDSHGTLSVAESAYKSRFKLSGSAVVMITPPTPLRVDVQIHEETGAEQTIGGGTATADNVAGTQLTDSAATFQTDGVAIGDKVRNLTDGSEALVTGISSENVITHGALSGGSSNDWTAGDVYAIGVKISTSAAYSALKGITLTPNGVSAPTAFDFDDLALGDPTTFFVYGVDFANEEVSEPFNWRVQGV